MKKIKKILLASAMASMLAVPAVLTGCFGGQQDKTTLKLFSDFKTEYYQGETLDLTGAKLEYTENGTSYYINIDDEMISGFKTDVAGSRNMEISYKGASLVVEYNVAMSMQEKSVYYLYRGEESGGPGYTILYIDRSEEKLYFSSVDATNFTIDEAIENFYNKTNLVFVEAIPFFEKIEDGKGIVTSVLYEGEVMEQRFEIVPINSTQIKLALSSGSGEDLIEEIHTFNLYTA